MARSDNGDWYRRVSSPYSFGGGHPLYSSDYRAIASGGIFVLHVYIVQVTTGGNLAKEMKANPLPTSSFDATNIFRRSK